MFYYQHHISDYRSATAHLSNGEDIAYRRLLDLYYEQEGPLSGTPVKLARLVRCAEADVVAVLVEFFEIVEGRYRHGRCEREIAAFTDRAEVARRNGRKRRAHKWGKPKARKPAGSQRDASGIPPATPEATQTYPRSELPQYPNTPILLSSLPSGAADVLPPEKEGRKEAIDLLVESLSSSGQGGRR